MLTHYYLPYLYAAVYIELYTLANKLVAIHERHVTICENFSTLNTAIQLSE